jgi:hypothetical protein
MQVTYSNKECTHPFDTCKVTNIIPHDTIICTKVTYNYTVLNSMHIVLVILSDLIIESFTVSFLYDEQKNLTSTKQLR